MSEAKLPGVFDILPTPSKALWQSSHLWQYVEEVIRETCLNFGYREIRTPIFEKTELFKRGVGENTDIVSKEMYTFEDRGGRSLTLKPEGTAPVIRAFIENHLQEQSQIHKLFYINPMFRYERQQAGRYRQHHQFGAEAIGVGSPEQDVELIDLLLTLYRRLNLKNLSVYLNCIGSKESRQLFREKLVNHFRASFDSLSEDSKRRLEENPLRILDSKDPSDRKIAEEAPSILDSLDEESRSHFESVKKLLTELKIPFEINPHLVRGLDYYNKTVFEITSGELGAQNSVGGGGRYDGLMKTLGGPDLPTVGFGTGIERIIQAMIGQNVPLPKEPHPTVYLIPLGESAINSCFLIAHELREMKINSDVDLSRRKIGKMMHHANTLSARYTVVIGENELKSGMAELKEMATGRTTSIPIKQLGRLIQLENQQNLLTLLWDEARKPFETKEEAEFLIRKITNSIEQTKQITDSLQTAVKNIREII